MSLKENWVVLDRSQIGHNELKINKAYMESDLQETVNKVNRKFRELGYEDVLKIMDEEFGRF